MRALALVLATGSVLGCARPDGPAAGGGGVAKSGGDSTVPIDSTVLADLAASSACQGVGTHDPGEPDDSCSGQSVSLNEGNAIALTGNRILPAGDIDTFAINFVEGAHNCGPGSIPHYWATVTLISPSGSPTTHLALGNNTTTCDNTWRPTGSRACVDWDGSCGGTPGRTVYFQVAGDGGTNSCESYTLDIHYCSEGDHCGC
jgi:hypothetical protein